ncbi:glutamate--tRNA ligase [Geothermobacter hydrogeniphilus]|uniref:Glutamate--tRNA ligase n=1 Tax=Geothermobacter hydrogeniphilus TaxID=1969733 RepID=A0A2K2H6X0_9BACT|nr:glutamate--tRNA ligase [Geothermobacter hydrogeniphilus]PNU19056.1 glutamate--tRNA ligase [Geothermobacter hydrogeniphilus]
MSDLRVRFAPSPTGYLHIGGARTALFNYLLARKQGGTFVLRIEDTDVERSTRESVDAILQAMDWLGLDYDEGPLYQSDRFDLYQQKIDQLLTEGKAYRCYCSAEELASKREVAISEGRKPKYDGTCRDSAEQPADRPHVVRFKAPQEGEIAFVDRIKGRIAFNNEELDDLIIRRTDGTPTYNLVVVIDDAEMGINLVVRGDDHVNNTPRQIQLYRALGYPVPEFAHVPMILGSDKTRLSKRHGATSVMAYRDQGFLPEAMVNYLVRLGWSHGDQEIFGREELIEKFSLDHVGRAAGVFNPEKLLWLNAHYIKHGDPARLAPLMVEQLEKLGLSTAGGPDPATVVMALQERARTLVEMAENAAFFYRAQVLYDPADQAKFITPAQRELFMLLQDRFAACDNFTAAALKAEFSTVLEQLGLGFGKGAQPLRVAMTGSRGGPDLFLLIELLGRERVRARLAQSLALLA